MKYYSEILQKAFDTEDACLKAEKDHEEKVAAQKAAAENLAKARKARAKEVEDALHALQEAKDNYLKVLKDFCKDYGAFHYSWTNDKVAPSLLDFLDWF